MLIAEFLLQNKEYDIVVCGVYPNGLLAEMFDISVWYLHSYFDWFVPTAANVSPNMIIWKALQNNIKSLIMLIAAFVTIILLVHAIQIKFNLLLFSANELIKTTEIMLRAIFATSSHWLPKATRIRLILGFWLFGCIFISVYIQTSFIATLMKPGVESVITTHEELLKSNLQKVIGKP